MRKYFSIIIVSMFLAVFSVYSEDVKSSEASDDLLIDDLDKDVLSVTKTSADTVKTDTSKNQSEIKQSEVKEPEVKQSVIKSSEAEDELILEGGEEDLLGTVKSSKPADSVSKAVAQPVSPAASQQEVKQNTITPEKAAVTSETKSVAVPIDETVKVVEGKANKVEATNSINFARNLKEYRSPKIAMLLSLLLPGAGEVYTKHGFRAAVFGTIELGIIGAGIAYSVKGGRQIDDAHDYADQHYQLANFQKYYNSLKATFPVKTIDSVIFIYGDKPEKFSKKSSDYYDQIGDEAGPYVQGWDDAAPMLVDPAGNFGIWRAQDTALYHQKAKDTATGAVDSTFLIYKGKDTTTYAYGYSQNQKIYNDKISKGNKSYKVSKNIFTLLLVNHIMSAIDAGICAKAYNDKLLGKQTVWQKINIKDIAVNSGSGIANGYALQVRF